MRSGPPATIVWLGSHEFGRWEATEMRAAVERAHQNPALRVLPVLL